MKPGYKTTEFWLTLLSLVLGALGSAGAIGPDESAELETLIAPLIIAAVPVALYIWSRTRVKEAAAESAIEPAQE